MYELKPLDIAHKFCQCILQESTGNRTEFAGYLGISPCRVTTYKNKLETIYKIKIHYSRNRQTYYINETDKDKLLPLI